MVGQMHDDPVEAVRDRRAGRAAGGVVGPEHEVVDEELRAPSEEVRQRGAPSSVSNRYSLSIRTHGSSCRRRARSSLRRVSSFSASSSSSRAASHSLRVPVMCFVIALLLPSIRPDGRWSWDTLSAGYRNGGSDKCDGIPMESLITAAARA